MGRRGTSLIASRLRLAAWERRIRSAYLCGAVVDLGAAARPPSPHAGHPGAGPALPAAVLVDLLTRPTGRLSASRPALRLRGARITGTMDLAGVHVTASVNFDRCWFEQVPDVSRATVPHLRLSECRLPGLDARLIELRGDLHCLDCEFLGPVDLRYARVGGSLRFDGGRLHSPGRVALNADGATVHGTVAVRGLHCGGEIRMCTTSVGGAVTFGRTVLDGGDGRALTMDSAHANELWLTWVQAPRGVVSLINSRVSRLGDNPATWPEQLCLRGLTYETIEGGATAATASCRERLWWLRRDPRGFSPQPYEQLAGYYRRTGHDVEARRVLLAKQRQRRGTLAWPGKLAGWLQDALVGYGYRSWLALGWLCGFWLAGTVLFATHPPLRNTATPGPDYHAAVYTLDLLLPVVDLGQEKAWQLVGDIQYAAYALSLAGWTLTAAVAAGAARLFNRL